MYSHFSDEFLRMSDFKPLFFFWSTFILFLRQEVMNQLLVLDVTSISLTLGKKLMAVSCRTDCIRTLFSYFSDEFLRISDFKPLCAFYWDLSLHLDGAGKHLRLRFTLFLFLFFWEEHFMFLDVRLYFFSRSCALFTGPVSTLFRKKIK